METIPAAARHDLTEEQWAVLEPLLPKGNKPGRPPIRSKRRLIDGIRWRTRTGAPWRDLPERYGPWQSVYSLFRRWQRAGIWRAIFTALQSRDAAGLITWDISIDSTVARAHQHAAGARRDPAAQVEPPGNEPADHALGRSRGGWSTKLHVATEQGRRLRAASAYSRATACTEARCARTQAARGRFALPSPLNCAIQRGHKIDGTGL